MRLARDSRTTRHCLTIASPVRALGAARIVAGGWLVATGAITLGHVGDLLPQAERLFTGDAGTTDGPLRSLLTLITAPVLLAVGVALITKGLRWRRRLELAPAAPLDRDDVVATLVNREPPAYGNGPVPAYWLLRRWLSGQLADLTWWRRDLMSRGVKAFVRSCGFTIAIVIVHFARPYLLSDDLFGPFPLGFVTVLLAATGLWAALGLMLIASNGPRIESFEFPLPEQIAPGEVIESPPRLLDPESPALGLTLGIVGLGVQCMMASWWKLSFVGYPLMATSIIRHAGSLAGGIVLFLLGSRMVAAAAALLMTFRYESTLVYTGADTSAARIGHGAAVRTERVGLGASRQLTMAVSGANARDDVDSLLGAHAPAKNPEQKWQR